MRIEKSAYLEMTLGRQFSARLRDAINEMPRRCVVELVNIIKCFEAEITERDEAEGNILPFSD